MTNHTVKTLYTDLDINLYHTLKNIRLLVCDVDGIFSDGRIYLGNAGEELKAFHTKDGYGIKSLQSIGVAVAIITGRSSLIVEQRMQALGVKHIIQGCETKGQALADLLASQGLKPEQVAAMGDDMPDVGMFELAAVKITVADGHPMVKQQANWITTLSGGFGAVREVTDTLLQAQGNLSDIHGASV
ncbi:3-deoxy-manno-octulosonate-8-phosphatase KdsC [Opacimonas viscosa]|uniref:3-deoxy-D-manno-octulosonate 8-phosphate phosphatase KdsC n=1 Tax=Opacimonas viscosa TaxID=2961944 RepID=A0AA41WZF7_9ALTE|nr:3-deoxy-manno-octulosonate-8-phosphatase KdsC [Opacimonas viscosa]MCP3429334.1 3-deoxy-manno-octulosonate-8-phosphatase KdsC [Opacimonas viscosa]